MTDILTWKLRVDKCVQNLAEKAEREKHLFGALAKGRGI